MKRLKFIFWVSILFVQASYAQVPASSFTAPPSACLQESLVITNSSTNSNSYQWDACADDFQTLKSNLSVATLTNLSNGFGYKLVEDNGNWYGFVVSQGGLRLFRMDFGNSPLNVPSQTIDLGNPGNSLSFPQDIEIYKANGKWYGFVGSNDNGYGIVRLDFGTSITNAPTATNIGTFGVFGRFWDLKVIEQSSNLILVINERNNGTLIRVNYRNAFENAIVNATHVFVTSSITSNLSPGFDLIQNNGNWIALLTSYGDNRLYQVNFGSDLLSTPTLQSSFSLSTFNRPMRVRIVPEGNRFVGVVSNESSAISIVDLKDLNPVNAPTLISHSGLPNFLGLDVERFNGKSLVLGVGSVDNRVRQLIFESDCGITSSFLSTTSPTIKYSTAGTKVIELKAINTTNGLSALSSRTVTITSVTAPDIDFSIVNNCVSSPINFSAINSSGTITSYSWNFGDGNLSTGSTTQHTYATASSYPISLVVNSSSGCSNTASKAYQIYNVPQANFTLPAASPFCTNQSYTFTNTSTFDLGSSPTWQWSVNGNSVSSSKDLSTSFSSTSAQQIQLIASLPGCNSQSIQTINSLATGPLINFSVTNPNANPNVCQSTPVTFNNTTVGSVTSYSWSFGDGNTSTQTNPQNTFSTTGSYPVTLQANNAAGCQNSLTQSITVYTRPAPDFSVGAPPFSCAGSATTFMDATPIPTDSNLTSWAWSFGDAANGSSSLRNPTYTYPTAATYEVSLTVATNFGCTHLGKKTVVIAPSPIPNFTNSAACKDQLTQFTDTSTGSIATRSWLIQGNTINISNPTYTFTAAGSFPVVLNLTGSNGCVAQISKTVSVPVPATLDFQISNPCVNSATVFTEITNTTDPAVSQAWVFGSIGSGTSTPATFSFPAAANYNVKLSSTRQSGCTYSLTKSISVSDAPIASFTSSVESGGAPLPVSFTNTSSGATSYLWKFGDALASTSVLASPSFTYTNLGDYNVELTVTNAAGCSNKASSTIRVVVPSIDLVLTDFYLSKDVQTGNLQPVVTVTNKSNITITNPYILIEWAGGATVRKQLLATIKPANEITSLLDFQLIPQTIKYICAEVEVKGDTDLFLNRKCVGLNDEQVVLTPYPNPAFDVLTLDWISISGSSVSVDIFNASGTVVFQQNSTTLAAGLNRLNIPVEALPAGIYFIRFSDSITTQSFKFAVGKK
ncbi:MAG: PKD domain-containing protein [Cyclobacteriaceae bacterium]|jgi:PKD repeat protein|nr:PKD domain-containing protein [Flammeovirgaceae bacterium]